MTLTSPLTLAINACSAIKSNKPAFYAEHVSYVNSLLFGLLEPFKERSSRLSHFPASLFVHKTAARLLTSPFEERLFRKNIGFIES